MNRAMRIIIRGTNWLGDSVITIPAVRALRRLYPSASLDMLAPESFTELWECEGSLDGVIGIPRPTGLAGKLRAVRRVRAGRYDLGVLFPNSFESALWFLLGGVRERMGYDTCFRGMLLTRREPPPPPGRHQVHRYLALVGMLGDAGAESVPSLPVPGALQVWARNLLWEKGVGKSGCVVGINPGATYGSAKCWPPPRFVSLIRMLRERLGATAVVVGSARERRLAVSLCREAGGGALAMAGRTTVMQLAALIGQCKAFVSNDTGPMHLACAVGTPVAAIMGPTDPEATGPLGKSAIVRKAVDCSPCLARECPTDHRCMERISVEEVFGAVEGLLEGTIKD